MGSEGGGEEEITEDQWKRAEANRLAALAKRKAIVSDNQDGFQSTLSLFKCRKLSPETTNAAFRKPRYPFVKCGSAPKLEMHPPVTEKFLVRLEICSPDSFSVTPMPAPGFPYPGEEACLEKLSDWLSDIIPSHYTQNNGGGKACVFKLSEYDMVLRSLKKCEGIKYEEIPWGTLNVVEKMSHSYASGKWIPCRPEHLADEKVDELIQGLPKVLLDALLPFQMEGVRFGLRRGARCLIADEMGLGKTLQAIAIAGCFINEGPILIVCPAILRFSWAEELERWLPFCLPSDIHLVFGHLDNPVHLSRCPRIVVISYTMLEHLQRSMLEREWATLIVDESHHLRCSKKTSEPKEIKSVLSVAAKVKHIILLSGTPSLSRPFDIFHQINMLWPGLLGKTKYEFASTYCSVNFRQGSQGKQFQDFSRGIRLEELNILLKQTIMIRRLKQHVMAELPPIRRKIIRMDIKKSDIIAAKAALGDTSASADAEDELFENCVTGQDTNGNTESDEKRRDQILGLAKLPGFLEWLSLHPMISDFNCKEAAETSFTSQKMIIFAYHHKVLDGIQRFISEKGIECIRIDGNNSNPLDRKTAVQEFQSSSKVKIALMGILAGGTGLNLTAAQDVVFLELPKENANLDQAESRAHRLGQTKAVNVYIFCAKDTLDESRWQIFNDRLFRVSSTINGKYEAIHEIKVNSVSHFEPEGKADENSDKLIRGREVSTGVSVESFVISQSEDQGSFKGYNGSYEMVDKSNKSHKETHIISSQVENVQVEQDIPSFACKGSSETSGGTDGSSSNLEDNEGWHLKKVNIVDEVDANPGGIIEPNDVAVRSSMPVSSLRFEVSRYTGRVHLYSCIPGIDSRPQPLFRSFRSQELDSENHLSEDGKRMVNKCGEDYPYYRLAVLTFFEEWNQLRPIERRKLLAKPLQLPLSSELCYLDESLNHSKGGLLKGGSKRRRTPIDEISNPLPSNASWRKVNLFSTCGKKEKIYRQGWSSMDEPLCKLCQNPCKNSNSRKPEFFEDLFCNLGCYEEYRLRTTKRSLREELFQIEHGICTNCQLDCHKLVKQLQPLSYEKRQEHIRRVAPKLAMRKKLFDKLVQDPAEGNAWHADHIVPVYKGGGECRLENMRTLCVTCHADVTAAQCAERRIAMQKAKRELKVIMNNLKDGQEPGQIDGKESKVVSSQEHEQTESRESMEEDLLIEVPGSAYSRPEAVNTGGSPEQEPST